MDTIEMTDAQRSKADATLEKSSVVSTNYQLPKAITMENSTMTSNSQNTLEADITEDTTPSEKTSASKPNTTIKTQCKSPWLTDFILPTEAEIEEIKESRRNGLIKDICEDGASLERSEDIVDDILNKNVLNAYIKMPSEDGTVANLIDIIMEDKSTKVADLFEPKDGEYPATISHKNYFDAKYTTSLRGGETYFVVYNHTAVAHIINTISNELISKKMLVKVLIQNIILSGLTSTEIDSIEKKLIRNDFLKRNNTFIADVAKAKNDLKNVRTISAIKYDEEEQALEIMKDYAVLNNHGSIKIIDTTKQGLTVSSKGELKTFFEPQELLCLDKVSGKMKMVNPVDIWMKSKKRKEFYGTKFNPSSGTNGEAYNLFKGFKHEAKELGDITLFKTFVREVLCSGEELMFNIVWTFLAQMVQDPTRKMGTALVLLSAKGTGKSSFLHVLGKLMEGYFMQTAENKRLLGEFNNHLSSTLLFYANELTFTDNKRVVSKLKNVITETSFTYELKGGATYTDPNYTRIIIDSNDDTVVVQTADERRFIYPVISESKIADNDYFNELYASFEEDGFYESLMYDLMDFDYSDWEKYLKIPPKNEVTQEQMLESFNDIEAWWLYCLEEGRIPHAYYDVTHDDKLNISNEDMYQSFRKYTSQNGRRVKLDSATFKKAFKKHALGNDLALERKTKIKINGERKNSYLYVSRSECVNYFISSKKLESFDYDGTEWVDCSISA